MPSHDSETLWTIDEIGSLIAQRGNAAETLQDVVQLVQHRFHTDVCSAYLLEPDRANLVLAATVGLRPESVGRVRMRLSEGLAGLVAEQLRPQFVADAATHPRFKYFSEAGEDPYRSFLGVPVMDRGLLQGVLVVQTAEPRVFTSDDIASFVAAAAQLGPIVGEARTLGQFVAPAHRRLSALAQNLWWSWDPDMPSLFRELDPALWREVSNNPVALLQKMSVEAIEERASELALHSRINYGYRRMQEPCIRGGPGVPGTRAFCGRTRLPTSLPNSACTNRCRSIPGAWHLAGDHVKVRPTSASRSSASASTTTKAISGSVSTRTAGSTKTTSPSIIVSCRFGPRWPTACRWSYPSTRRPAPSSPASGNSPSGAARSCCSIQTSMATSRKIGN